MTSAPTPPESDSAETIARVKALAGRRDAAQHTSATPARILVAGASASAALILVGAMAASARSMPAAATAAPQVVERVVTIEIPAQQPTPAAAPSPTVDQVQDQITVVREVRTLPAPAADPAPAPAATQGS